MSESERLVRKAGGKLVAVNTHKVYVLKGHTFNLHCGSKPKAWELQQVKRDLRKLEKA